MQQFRVSAYVAMTGAPPQQLSRGLQELTLLALVAAARGATAFQQRYAINLLLIRASMLFVCPMLVLLAARLRPVNAWRRYLATGSFPLALVASRPLGVDVPWLIAVAILLSVVASVRTATQVA